MKDKWSEQRKEVDAWLDKCPVKYEYNHELEDGDRLSIEFWLELWSDE